MHVSQQILIKFYISDLTAEAVWENLITFNICKTYVFQ